MKNKKPIDSAKDEYDDDNIPEIDLPNKNVESSEKTSSNNNFSLEEGK